MTRKTLSKLSTKLKIIGAGKLLPNLRGDLEQAQESVFIVGPWLDGFFAEEVINCLNKKVKLNCLVRTGQEHEIDEVTRKALFRLKGEFPFFSAHSLAALHAKAIIIDSNIAYVGSTNWYQYSLEEAKEITIRIRGEAAEDVINIMEEYYLCSEVLDLGDMGFQKTVKQRAVPKINHEILDPIAQEVLRQNPKAYIKGYKTKK